MDSKPAREDETLSGVNWKLFLLVAGIIGIVFVGMLAMQSDGNSVDGPSAEAGGPGSGIDPNPAEADPAMGVDPEKSTSVPVKHLTERELQRFSKGEMDIKEGVLYLYEHKYEYEGLTNEIPVGSILIDKDKLSELEFDFGGFHLSNFSVETRKDEKGSTIVIADIEGARYQSVDWAAQLLDSDKKIL